MNEQQKKTISDRFIVKMSNFYFLLQTNYNEFNLEILYTDGVG
jgi:hypothetical protein